MGKVLCGIQGNPRMRMRAFVWKQAHIMDLDK